jgi:hypothetical protein
VTKKDPKKDPKKDRDAEEPAEPLANPTIVGEDREPAQMGHGIVPPT